VSTLRTPFRRLLGGAGVVILLLGAALYAELLGVVDFIKSADGLVTIRPPIVGDRSSLQIRPETVVRMMRRGFPGLILVAAGLMIGFAALLRNPLRLLISRWPRGLQGLVALSLVIASALAFLPLGLGRGLGVAALLMSSGFVLTAVGIGPTVLGRVGNTTSDASAWLARYPGLASPWVAAACLLAMSTALTWIMFQGTPHVWDAVSHIFHAEILASGRLFVDSHPLREFFHGNTIVNNGHWYSQYPPGHTLMLAIGAAAGVPWLVNPVLGALFVLALAGLGRACYGNDQGRLSLLLALASPFVVLMSTEFYSHASAILWVTLALCSYVRFMRGDRGAWIVATGTFLGLCAITRPLTALGVGLPLTVDALAHASTWWKGRRLGAATLGVLSSVVICGGLLAYNNATGGSPFSFGYGAAHGPGFGVSGLPTISPPPQGASPDSIVGASSDSRGATASDPEVPSRNLGSARQEMRPIVRPPPAHPYPWWLRVSARVQRLNDALFALPFPSLLLVLLAFLGPRSSRWDYLLLSIPLGLLAVYAPVTYWESEFGPRYVYEACGPLLLLAARGVSNIGPVVQHFGITSKSLVPQMRGAVLIGFLLGALLLWPPRIEFYGSPGWGWALRDDVADAVDAAKLRDALVFVDTSGRFGDRPYLAVFLRNGLDLDATDVLYARDLGARNEELQRLFPERRAFLFSEGELTPMR